MEPIRTKDSYNTFLDDFNNEILLECNICSSISIFRNNKIICENCGFNKNLENETYLLKLHDDKILGYNFYTDSKEKNNLKLWFSTDCCNETLWAYNRNHLNFLKEHIESTLRERNNIEYSNQSLGSRLPKWMLSKKNRESVLKAIEKLNHK